MTSTDDAFSDLETLWGRPGFLIRRAHQIAQTLFLEETGELGITATQYGVLRILSACPSLDQIGVAQLLGQDRSTTALVVEKLVTDGLVGRCRSLSDRRRRELVLMTRGEEMLAAMADRVRRAQDKLLSPLSEHDADRLLELLRTVTDHFNDTARTPLHRSPTRRAHRELPASR